MLKNIVSIRDFKESEILEYLNIRHINGNKSRIANNMKIYPEKQDFLHIIKHFLKINLTYNQKTGYTLENGEHSSNYSYLKDIPVYDNKYDILEDELINNLYCEHFRLQRIAGIIQ